MANAVAISGQAVFFCADGMVPVGGTRTTIIVVIIHSYASIAFNCILQQSHIHPTIQTGVRVSWTAHYNGLYIASLQRRIAIVPGQKTTTKGTHVEQVHAPHTQWNNPTNRTDKQVERQ